VLEVVDVDVEVDAAVVTGVVVVVTAASTEVELLTAIDDDVDAESVDAALSLLHPAVASATRTNGTRQVGFTVGSLARFVAVT
jgi:hypothetical protein